MRLFDEKPSKYDPTGQDTGTDQVREQEGLAIEKRATCENRRISLARLSKRAANRWSQDRSAITNLVTAKRKEHD